MSEPAPPGPKVSTSAAKASSTSMPAMMPRGRSRLGSRGLLGRERDALDRQEEPDRVREGGPDADVAERQELRVARRGPVRRDVRQVRRVELRDHPQDEDDQRDGGDRGDDEDQLERLADAVEVDADEDGVEEQEHRPAARDPEEPERLDVAADEHGDRGGRDHVLDEDRRAGGEAPERAERTAREGVAAARGRQRRGHLGQAEDHAGVHRRHQHRGDQQAAPAALGQAEVPAREVARDDVGDAQAGQQHPAGRAALELALLEIALVDLLVVDRPAGRLRFLAHDPLLPRVAAKRYGDPPIGWRKPSWHARRVSTGSLARRLELRPHQARPRWRA